MLHPKIATIKRSQWADVLSPGIRFTEQRCHFRRFRQKERNRILSVEAIAARRWVSQVGAEPAPTLRDERPDKTEFGVEHEPTRVFACGHSRQQHTREKEWVSALICRESYPLSFSRIPAIGGRYQTPGNRFHTAVLHGYNLRARSRLDLLNRCTA